MIGEPTIGRLHAASMTAVGYGDTLEVIGPDGQPAQLAIVDSTGRVIEAGAHVAAEARAVAVTAYRSFLRGEGHLVTLSAPAKKADAA